MSDVSSKWRLYDTLGRCHQPPTPKKIGDYFSCADGRDGSNFGTAHQAVAWWALFRVPVSIVEIVPPFELSMRERCEKAIDDLWERVRLMGEADGGNGTGGIVRFVIDDAGGVEEQDWLPEECDAALDGIALALSAIHLMDTDE